MVRKEQPLRIGFVPLTDCAPVVMAQELGLFSKYGLRVALKRELGWAAVRDKIVYGELDASHAVAAMPAAITLGIGCIRCDCLTGLILNLNGNAITISNDLWKMGVRDAARLREEIRRVKGGRVLTLGVVSRFSSHNFLLRHWLRKAGINPETDLRIVVAPPAQMVPNLKAGNLDGFCAGEPWNSLAVDSGVGWCAAVSAELDPDHPEKALIVREEFANRREDEHIAMIAALLEACEFCQAPENHHQVAATLARPEFVGVSAAILMRGISGEFDFGHGEVRAVSRFNVFFGDNANEPCARKAAWALHHMALGDGASGVSSSSSVGLHRRVFRADIFEKAERLRHSAKKKDLDHDNENETQMAAAA